MDYPETSSLLWAKAQGVLTLTMNRPEALNALTVEMLQALISALEAAERDDEVRVVVLTGSGRGFSAGQDLEELKAASTGFSVEAHLRRHYSPLITRLADFPKPTVARINGIAAGAGAGLALAMDLKLMADHARFILAFAQLGLVLDSGTSYFLVHGLGRTRALEIALLGTPLTAEEALACGLINRVAEAPHLDDVVREWVDRLTVGPALAYRLIKRALRQAEGATLADMLELETGFQVEAAATLDHQRALAAFVNKEPSPFSRSHRP